MKCWIIQSCSVTSGTASLETALMRVPQVVCYAVNPVTYWIARFWVKVNYISLVNLIVRQAGRSGMIQKDFYPVSVKMHPMQVMLDTISIQDAYLQLRKTLGTGDTSPESSFSSLWFLQQRELAQLYFVLAWHARVVSSTPIFSTTKKGNYYSYPFFYFFISDWNLNYLSLNILLEALPVHSLLRIDRSRLDYLKRYSWFWFSSTGQHRIEIFTHSSDLPVQALYENDAEIHFAFLKYFTRQAVVPSIGTPFFIPE